MLILISIFTFIATFLGGLFALRFKDHLHLILGFSAGAVIGVAFFDLLPEAIELSSSYNISLTTSLIALGFLIYMILDRTLIARCHEGKCENKSHKGFLGAASLVTHSFLDGIAIGLAFQVSGAVGIIMSIAVIVHDFSDGINTVNVVIKSAGSKKDSIVWLALCALAPALGITATLFFTLSSSTLGLILAIFCGFFLYIGASDLLPESHHAHPTKWTTFLTVVGALVIYIAIRLAGN